MVNIQAQMKELFGNSCLAYCYAYKAHPTAGIKILTNSVLRGWFEGYIEDDGYVAKPVLYYNNLTPVEGRIKDVVKMPLEKLSDLPEGTWIVEFKLQRTDRNSHFAVCTSKEIVFDPSGDSNTCRYGVPVSYRSLVHQEAA